MDVLDRQKLREQILETKDLPTLPTSVAQLLNVVDNPKTTAQTLSEIIGQDPVLMAKILKVANSAFYGFPKKIATLNLAVVVLGFSSLRQLCLSVGIIDIWSESMKKAGMDMEKFWKHSIATGVAAKLLSRKMRFRLAGEAFVGGLIHDIGKLILNQNLPEHYKDVLAAAETAGKPLWQLEIEMLGISHCDVGGWLTGQWNLPDDLVLAVSNHHNEFENESGEELPSIVRAADALTYHMNNGAEQSGTISDFKDELERLSAQFRVVADEIPLEKLEEEFKEELENSKTFFELSKGVAA